MVRPSWYGQSQIQIQIKVKWKEAFRQIKAILLCDEAQIRWLRQTEHPYQRMLLVSIGIIWSVDISWIICQLEYWNIVVDNMSLLYDMTPRNTSALWRHWGWGPLTRNGSSDRITLTRDWKHPHRTVAVSKTYYGFHPACHLWGSISSKHNVSLLFSIWDAELVILRCTRETHKSQSEIWRTALRRFLPADIFWPKVSKIKNKFCNEFSQPTSFKRLFRSTLLLSQTSGLAY